MQWDIRRDNYYNLSTFVSQHSPLPTAVYFSRDPRYRYVLKKYCDAHESHANSFYRVQPLLSLTDSRAQLLAVEYVSRKYGFESNPAYRIADSAIELLRDQTFNRVAQMLSVSESDLKNILLNTKKLHDAIIAVYDRTNDIRKTADELRINYETARKHIRKKYGARRYRKLTDQEIRRVLEMRQSGKSLSEIARELGYPVSTIYYVVKRSKTL